MNDDQNPSRRGLRLIPGGRNDEPRIVIAPEEAPPFDVEAIALEDDTYAVLAADTEIQEPTEHPIRLWTRVHAMSATEPGGVRVEPGHPARLLAIVHDLSEEPSWREGWIAGALEGIFREVAARGWRSLALQPLGCVHGRFPVRRFFDLLRDALERNRPASLERLWLIRPLGADPGWGGRYNPTRGGG